MVVGRFRTTLFIVLAAVGLLPAHRLRERGQSPPRPGHAREKEFVRSGALGREPLAGVEPATSWRASCSPWEAAPWARSWPEGGLGRRCIGTILLCIIPAEAVIRSNGTVLLFTLAVAVLTAVVSGLDAGVAGVPARPHRPAARQRARARPADSGTAGLTRRGRGPGGGAQPGPPGRRRPADAELRGPARGGPGLSPDHILVARLPPPEDRYKTASPARGLLPAALARLKALPGVVEATETSTPCPPYGGIRAEVEVAGKADPEKWNALVQLCSEGYFAVVRIAFLEGRTFNEAEVSDGRKVAVVNQASSPRSISASSVPSASACAWPSSRTSRTRSRNPWFEVIGVVKDAKNQASRMAPHREAWVPYTVTGSGERGVLVRTVNDPLAHARCSPARDLGDGPQRGPDLHRLPRRVHQPVLVRGTPFRVPDMYGSSRRHRPGSSSPSASTASSPAPRRADPRDRDPHWHRGAPRRRRLAARDPRREHGSSSLGLAIGLLVSLDLSRCDRQPALGESHPAIRSRWPLVATVLLLTGSRGVLRSRRAGPRAWTCWWRFATSSRPIRELPHDICTMPENASALRSSQPVRSAGTQAGSARRPCSHAMITSRSGGALWLRRAAGRLRT